ncbi:MAG: nucleotidyl transferase AbiEii/AbiGii toxin family protein [bacterium]
MHKEILTKEQAEILPLIKKFAKNFGLVGGTAIAYHIGHRQSIDFDLFSVKPFGNLSVSKKILEDAVIDKVFINKLGEYTLLRNGVKITFFHYPYRIEFKEIFDNIIKMADLLTLSAMKAYALGMRAKWKDYVDLYFMMKEFYSIEQIIKEARRIFGDEFNEKIFRAQLAYFKDIDYSEKVIYMKGFETSERIIKKELVNFALL